MASYQLLTCTIALAGDVTQTVVRGAERAVTYPELIVLEFLHGENAVTEVFECGYTEDTEPRLERERLMHIYGAVVDKHLFPGHNIQMPVATDRYKPRLVGTLVNPGPPPVEPPPVEIDPEIAAGLTAKPARSAQARG
jgi:hypothetical protein